MQHGTLFFLSLMVSIYYTLGLRLEEEVRPASAGVKREARFTRELFPCYDEFNDKKVSLNFPRPLNYFRSYICNIVESLAEVFGLGGEDVSTTTTTTTTTTTASTATPINCAAVGGTQCAADNNACITMTVGRTNTMPNTYATVCAATGSGMGVVYNPTRIPFTDTGANAISATEMAIFACIGLNPAPADGTRVLFGPLPNFNRPNPSCNSAVFSTAGVALTKISCDSNTNSRFACSVPT